MLSIIFVLYCEENGELILLNVIYSAGFSYITTCNLHSTTESICSVIILNPQKVYSSQKSHFFVQRGLQKVGGCLLFNHLDKYRLGNSTRCVLQWGGEATPYSASFGFWFKGLSLLNKSAKEWIWAPLKHKLKPLLQLLCLKPPGWMANDVSSMAGIWTRVKRWIFLDGFLTLES